MAINSYDVACEKKKSKKQEPKSPYLTSDRVQLLSRVTEKRFIHKKTLDYVSSFPLAVNIYKANSDEFKSLKRAKKKIKKSVLTLPNEPTPTPQVCTVSDMNDSEYYSQNNDNQVPRIKKRSSIKNVRKCRPKNKDFEFYDRDARYCSQLNIDLDSSSTDLIKDYKGDSKRLSKRQKGYKSSYSAQRNKENEVAIKPHDVWAVLRNMKRFQFKPSPPVSDESIVTPKKKSIKKRVNCKDTRVIETCRTEEIAYISSYKVDDSSRSLSESSSFDRITVIDKQDKFSKICKEFEERFLKTGLNDPSKNNNQLEANNNDQMKRPRKINAKTIRLTLSNENDKDLTPAKHDDTPCVKVENDRKYDQPNNIDNEPSLTNFNDSRYVNYSEVTSVCSKTNNNENTMKVVYTEPVKDCCNYSDHSGSSKAEITVDETNIIQEKKHFNGRVPQLKGISKVVFGTKCEPMTQIASKRVDEHKRKSRLVTTMPSGCTMPKLTKTEIQRRLATMKFPLVILGKDQVSSSIEVQNYEHPQFNGLDEQIWPFMIGWDEKSQFKSMEENVAKPNVEAKDNSQLLKKCLISDPSSNKLKKVNNDVTYNKRSSYKSKKLVVNTDLISNKIDVQRQAVCPEANKKGQLFKRQESIANIKEKMLNLLYKKQSDRKIGNDSPKTNTKESKTLHSPKKTVDASTDIQTKSILSAVKPKVHGSPVRNQNKKNQRNGLHRSHPWAKAKWASDFIENVIKKIKSGVYYNQGVNRLTEISIQTEPIVDQEDILYGNDFSPKVTIKKKRLDVPKIIPGFEKSLPGLEIKKLNMNHISIKHCIANVMMQFDVTVPGESKQLLMSPKASISWIPLEGTESHTKVIKCKTSILNAMLPAELCSILPKMVSLFDSDITPTLRPAVCSATTPKKESHLTAIRETTHVETVATNTAFPYSESPKLPLDCLIPAVKVNKFRGMFSKTVNTSTDQVITKTPLIRYGVVEIGLLPNIVFGDIDMRTYRIRSLVPVFLNINDNMMLSKTSKATLAEVVQIPRDQCFVLDPYMTKNKRLGTPFQPYDFYSTIRNILLDHISCKSNMNLMLNINSFKILYDCKSLNGLASDTKAIVSKVYVTISNIKIGSEFCRDKNNDHSIVRNTSSKSIEYIKGTASYNCENKEQTDIRTTNNKSKKKGFYRLYRKCKSTSNIPTVEKSINTPLNKIHTLEDFFQILGSKKMMSSVFDGCAARKILSSIGEMKNWITDINPRQALLVLLLINKKDTPNLVRFRPVLLQGIAVNRITRATELDMEIEVIERENLNKLSQYEGISYLPGSIENHDQLLEELYWIAKTTASDYQRPFDESSERLLRSLLEKRKKLNPSYLRVMARYVGLGLLKSPTKK